MKKIALIIGAQKSGTTSLFNYLAEHPQICPCREKEPFFFADDKRFNQGLSYYFSLWDWQPHHQIAIEASTAYTMSPSYSGVAERIARVPDVEFYFLYIMRNPLKRIESNVNHSLSTGVLDSPKVTERFISYSKYATQLDAFVNQFDRDKVHPIILEDLNQNTQQELDKIYKFFGLDSHTINDQEPAVFNSRQASHFKAHPFFWNLYRSKTINSIVGFLPDGVKKSLLRILPKSKSSNFVLSEQDKVNILNQLKPDLIRLRDEYGIDVESHWKLGLDGTSK